jgi:hypothetical protein
VTTIPRTEFDGPVFRCGHPRTEANSLPCSLAKRDGTRYAQCRFCARVRHMNNNAERAAKRAEERVAAGRLTKGERVCHETRRGDRLASDAILHDKAGSRAAIRNAAPRADHAEPRLAQSDT